MKLFKKLALLAILMVIIMSMAILLTANSVLAAVNTKDTGMVVYTDDFEHLSITENVSLAADTYLTGAYTSDVFASKLHQGRGTLHLLYDGGKDGTKALKLTPSSGNHNTVACRLPAATDTNDVLEMTYDLKMSYHTNTGDNKVTMGAMSIYNGNPVFAVEYDATTGKNYIENAATSEKLYEYDATKWYKVVIRQYNTGKRYGCIMDENGAIVAEASRDRGWSIISPAANLATAGSGAELIIDNIVLKHYNKGTVAPSYEFSSVADGDENIIRNEKITFVFDQEIADSSVIGFARKDGEEITEVTGIITEKKSFNTLVLKYQGILDRKTEYVLSFTGVTNGLKACGDDTITFTTEDLHLWNDVTISAVAANTEDATKTDITLTIADEYGYPTFEGMAMAVVYVPYPDTDLYTMTKADMVSANGATGERTLTFNLGIIPSNAKICVILLDTTNGPVPLASGMYE